MSNLLDVLSRLASPKLLVLGDLILDRYTWGAAERVSPEAPVLVLRADQDEVRLGGAASVAGLLRALEAEVLLAGVIGDDNQGRVLGKLLQEAGIGQEMVLTDPDRPTTSKERFMGRAANRHPQQILRVDREERHGLAEALESKLMKLVAQQIPTVQAVIISDYAKGTCTPRLLAWVIETAAAYRIPVLNRSGPDQQLRPLSRGRPRDSQPCRSGACHGKAPSRTSGRQ
jgi:D-beta-D-heptose 7-phosphate kinase/D-beta-D-heptose 1-phosphate adenosyltransferase